MTMFEALATLVGGGGVDFKAHKLVIACPKYGIKERALTVLKILAGITLFIG